MSRMALRKLVFTFSLLGLLSAWRPQPAEALFLRKALDTAKALALKAINDAKAFLSKDLKTKAALYAVAHLAPMLNKAKTAMTPAAFNNAKALFTEAKRNELVAKAKEKLAGAKPLFQKLATGWKGFMAQKANRALVERLILRAAQGKIDAKLKADTADLHKRMDIAEKLKPLGYTAYTAMVNVDLGVGLAGFTIGIGVAYDYWKNVRGIVCGSLGGGLFGKAAGEIAITYHQGRVENTAGFSVGLSGGGDIILGLQGSVSWNLTKNEKGHLTFQSPIPSWGWAISAGIGVQVVGEGAWCWTFPPLQME